MDKNEFDRDFDYDRESDFDPKAFLGTEEYDDDIDLSEFSDEELGLVYPEEPDEDEDVKEYIPAAQEEVPEEEDLLVFPRREEPVAEEAFADGEEVVDQSVFEDESDYEEDGDVYEEEESEYDSDEAYDEDEEEFQEEKPRFKFQLPKINIRK